MREAVREPPFAASLLSCIRSSARLRQLLGPERLLADDASRTYYANDIFWQPGIAPLAIALPETAEETAAVVAMAAAEGIAIVPRGGGMSYTKGYLPAKPASIVIDARRMNRIITLAAG